MTSANGTTSEKETVITNYLRDSRYTGYGVAVMSRRAAGSRPMTSPRPGVPVAVLS